LPAVNESSLTINKTNKASVLLQLFSVLLQHVNKASVLLQLFSVLLQLMNLLL